MSTGTACESSVQARTAMRTTSSHREYQVTCLISRIGQTSKAVGCHGRSCHYLSSIKKHNLQREDVWSKCNENNLPCHTVVHKM